MRKIKLKAFGLMSLATTLVTSDAASRSLPALPMEPVVPVIPGDVFAFRRLPFEPTPAIMPVIRYRAAEASARLRTGDLPEMQRHHRLRVLMLREQAGELGSRDIALERDLVSGFAREVGLVPEWVWVNTPQELPTALADGLGDVVIGDIPLDISDNPTISPTVALKQVRYIVVTRAGDEHVTGQGDLYGLRAGLSKSSPTWPLLDRMSAGHPAIVRVPTDGLTQSAVFEQLADRRFDFTVVEGNDATRKSLLSFGLREAMALTGNQSISWLVRTSNPVLRKSLNHHLNKNRLAVRAREPHHGDLDRILERGVLRVITRPDSDNFFISKGERAGFEYDLIREFCLRRGLRIEVVVADNDAQMLAWLKSGVGDVVTARVDRALVAGDSAVTATRMYHYVAPVLMARADLPAPARLEGRRVLVPRDSIFAQMLKRTRPAGAGAFELLETDPRRSPAELLDAVAGGEADYTVVEAPRVRELMRTRTDVQPTLSLQELKPYRFTVRSANPALFRALDDFLREEYGSEFYNAARRRYFDNEELFALQGAVFDRISPYDDLVKRYAERYGFDWRLIVAQMYEESRFKTDAVSSAGARGLMQVLPHTARSLGFQTLDKPELAIHAGVKYLDRQRAMFADTLSVADRTWFALAAYHAGFDRVQAARRQAARLGLDPDRWFGNVEKGMLDISRHSQGANRYRGGRATVSYVREVRSRYESYVQLQVRATVAAL